MSPTQNIQTTLKWIDAAGLSSDVDGLRVIHIAGTKGKGSTASFCESVLRAHGLHTALFTSPHLEDVRERIRINGELISQSKFVESFDHVYRVILMCGGVEAAVDKSAFFRVLLLMFLHAAVHEKVDAVILEVGLGGLYDATNALPVKASGITAIGYDHVEILGDTLEKIAAQKAGIVRPDTPCYTTAANLANAEVLAGFKESASARGGTVLTAPMTVEKGQVNLSLAGDHMFENANLAIALTRTLQGVAKADMAAPLTDAELRGLQSAFIAGRSQTWVDEHTGTTVLLDGAHTVESMSCATKWVNSALSGTSQHIALLFHCMPPRHPKDLLQIVASDIGSKVVAAYFFQPESQTPRSEADMNAQKNPFEWQEAEAVAWKEGLSADSSVVVGQLTPSSLDACLRDCSEKQLTLVVTGSLYLIGDVLKILRSRKN
eukprot:PhM_4_TR15140/c0_g1_i1/m.18921/K01930/FPGS; folylpolyglutamate synthase